MRAGKAVAAAVVLSALLAGCGGNSGSSLAPQDYTIGGTVTGLVGTGLVLSDNGTDSLTVTANGAFTFPTALASGQAYSVTVATQPTVSSPALPQTCFVTSGSGTVQDAAVTSVVVSCVNDAARFAYVPDGGSSEISGYSIDNQTGALTAISGSPFPAGAGPEALTIHPSGQFAYASNAGDATISEYTIDSTTGALAPISGSPLPVPDSSSSLDGYTIQPVVIDPSGKLAFVANPSVSWPQNTDPQPDNLDVYSIDATSGALTEAPGSPMTTGADLPNLVVINASDTFAYVANDLWQVGADECSLSVLSIDPATASVTAITGSPFHGPPICASAKVTSFIAAASGNIAYLTTSVGASSGLLQWLTLDPTTGAVTGGGGPATQPEQADTSAAVTDVSGKFLYVAGSIQTTIGGNPYVVFEYSIDATSGTLTYVGTTPTGAVNPIAVDPAGGYLYVADSTSIYAYSIDSSTGALTAVSGSPFTVASSSDTITGLLAIDPSGRFVYVPSAGSSVIYALSIDSATGALTAVPGSPFPSGASPGQISFVN